MGGKEAIRWNSWEIYFYVDKMNYGILIKITMLQYKPILDISVQYFDVTFSFFFMKPLRRIMMTNLNISMEENFSRVLLLWMACVTFFSIKKTWDQIWNKYTMLNKININKIMNERLFFFFLTNENNQEIIKRGKSTNTEMQYVLYCLVDLNREGRVGQI